MAAVNRNRTRYNTANILALLEWFESRMKELDLFEHVPPNRELSWREKHLAMWIPPKAIKIATASPRAVASGSCVGFNHSRLPSNYYMKDGRPCLKIIAPKNLPEDEPGRTLLMAVKDVRPCLPDKGTREVLEWYYAAGTMSHTKLRERGYEVRDLIKTAVGLPPVFADGRVADPVPKGDRGKEEKIARIREQFGDSSGLMPGSSKTSHHHWKSAMRWAKEYYDREFERRERWRQKLLDLGESDHPHMTFEEFLMHCVEELQNGRGIPR